MQNAPIHAVLFDLDGTLMDTAQDLSLSVNLTLAEFDYPPLDPEYCISLVGNGIPNLVRRAFGKSAYDNPDYLWTEDFLQNIVGRYKEIYAEHLLDHTQPYPSVPETLERLKSKKLALISNKAYWYTFEILKHFRMQSYFSVILGGDSLPEKKPDPEPLRHAMQALGVLPRHTLMVGDGEADMQAGRAAAVRICAVTYGMRPKSTLAAFAPDFWINRIEELLTLPLIS